MSIARVDHRSNTWWRSQIPVDRLINERASSWKAILAWWDRWSTLSLLRQFSIPSGATSARPVTAVGFHGHRNHVWDNYYSEMICSKFTKNRSILELNRTDFEPEQLTGHVQYSRFNGTSELITDRNWIFIGRRWSGFDPHLIQTDPVLSRTDGKEK